MPKTLQFSTPNYAFLFRPSDFKSEEEEIQHQYLLGIIPKWEAESKIQAIKIWENMEVVG